MPKQKLMAGISSKPVEGCCSTGSRDAVSRLTSLSRPDPTFVKVVLSAVGWPLLLHIEVKKMPHRHNLPICLMKSVFNSISLPRCVKAMTKISYQCSHPLFCFSWYQIYLYLLTRWPGFLCLWGRVQMLCSVHSKRDTWNRSYERRLSLLWEDTWIFPNIWRYWKISELHRIIEQIVPWLMLHHTGNKLIRYDFGNVSLSPQF